MFTARRNLKEALGQDPGLTNRSCKWAYIRGATFAGEGKRLQDIIPNKVIPAVRSHDKWDGR